MIIPASNPGCGFRDCPVEPFWRYFVWKYTIFRDILLSGINVLKKTFSRSWSRVRLSHTFRCVFPEGNNQHTNLPLLRLSAGVIIRGRMTPRLSKFSKGAVNQNDHEILLSAPLIYQGQSTGYWVCCQWHSWRRITLARNWSNSAALTSCFVKIVLTLWKRCHWVIVIP